MENNDLISRSELLKDPIRITGTLGGKYPFEAISVAAIENAPPVDAVPVVHGRWVIVRYEYYDCSVCGRSVYSHADSTSQAKKFLEENGGWPYCPSCGARMDGKEPTNGIK